MKAGIGTLILSIAIPFGWAAVAGCSASDETPQTIVGDPNATSGGGAGYYNPYAGGAGYNPYLTGASGSTPGVAGAAAGTTPLPTAGAAGAAGTAPVAGSGGDVAVAGTGGSVVGGTGGTGATGTSAGTALITTNGWISGSTNSFGIQGAWYVFCDSDGLPPGTSTISPSGDAPFAAATTICVSGSAGVIGTIPGTNPPQYDWGGATWGAGVGLNLNQLEGSPAASPYANPQGIKGFEVTLSGTVGGDSTIRVKYQVAGSAAIDYCTEVAVPGTHAVLFADTIASCWQAGGAPPSPTSISAIQFQVVSNQVAAKSFNFCVDSIAPIP